MQVLHDGLLILIPIYKQRLNLLEQFSIDYLQTKTPGRKICFVAPEGLDKSYYVNRYKDINYQLFEDQFFVSISGYNRLLLDVNFYRRFENYSHILIHQTDALLLKDDLDFWASSSYAYIGAPWPGGMSLNYAFDTLRPDEITHATSYVGNGGFSLRSIDRFLKIFKISENLHSFWLKSGFNEDCFFSFASMFSEDFLVPDQKTAALFSLEMEPEYYFNLNQGQLPTGGHAWWKYDLKFWQNAIASS
jgi:hypothetical protein